MAGIYIHIPFCKKRCIYCDFYSTTQSNRIDEYIDALCKELEMRKDYLNGEEIETIYFGGGTPSQLGKSHFDDIFKSIKQFYTIAKDAEITIEANPDNLSEEYVKMLSELPLNRISIGIQTFNDDTLKLLNRRHNSQQAIDAFNRCRKHGFKNISLDLMYGLPGESLESWKSDLSIITKLNPEHISAYHLIYEEGTKMWELKESHDVKEVSENMSVEMFSTLIETLKESGYEHYEISNFSKPYLYSRHNSSYWKGVKYLGCGPSAHSYDQISRQWNIASLDRYIEGINSGKADYEIEKLDITTQYNEFVITSIRTMWGMDLSILKEKFGVALYDYAMKMSEENIKKGYLEVADNKLKLTKEGIFISDGIMSDLLQV